MGFGRAVISTKTGAEGIEYTDGQNIMIADTAEEFVSAVSCLYKNPEEAARIGNNARQLIERKHNNRKIIQRLEAFYREIL